MYFVDLRSLSFCISMNLSSASKSVTISKMSVNAGQQDTSDRHIGCFFPFGAAVAVFWSGIGAGVGFGVETRDGKLRLLAG